MAEKLRLLDLFCGAGGAARGYHDAGFEEIVGVDTTPQPHYPYEFVLADAMEYPLEGFDLIHASPPCQAFTKYKNARPDLPERYPNLIPRLRQQLIKSDNMWIIENVEGSPLIKPITLCGSMFNLDIRRHRLFESNLPLEALLCNHKIWPPNRFPGGRSRERGHARVLCRNTIEIGRWNIPLQVQQKAMEIDWTNLKELSEAVPPAYTEYIGLQVIEYLESTSEAQNYPLGGDYWF